MRKLFSLFSFVLLFSFVAFGQAQIDALVTVTNGTNVQPMHIGLDQTATTCIDPTLGEGILPPPPPAGAFDIRWNLTLAGCAGIGTWRDYRNVVSYPYTGTITNHRITIQLATGATTVSFAYVIPAGASMLITDISNGGLGVNSGQLTGTGTYSYEDLEGSISSLKVTMTYTNISPIILGPNFDISPVAPLAFGTSNVGTPVTLPITVSNATGTADLIITNIVSSDPQFTFAPNTFPITVATGGTTPFNVTFTPTAGGLQNGNLVFTHNAPAAGTNTTYAMNGTGYVPAPIFGVSPSSLNFGTVNIGGAPGTRTFTVSNTGDAALDVTGLVSSDPQYTVAPGAVSIPVGGSQLYTVTFTPTFNGSVPGTITINHNAAGSPGTVTLAGIGHSTAAFFSMNPVSLDFGQVSVGQVSTLPVTVSNTGDAPLNITGIASDNALFTFAPAAPQTIAPGANVVFNVTFTPTTAAAVTGNITFTHDGPGPNTALPVAGSGRTQGGSLVFEIPSDTVLDGTNYTRSIMLHGYTGQPLKALQFDLVLGKTNGFFELVSVERGTAIGTDTNAFKFAYQVYPGAPRPDGSHIDRIKVVILGMGTNELPINTPDLEIMKFTYHVVQISGPRAETWNALEHVTGATSTPVHNANILAGPDQYVRIYNGTPMGLLGDVNLDNHVDILDILLMIDHILGRVTLVDSAFMMGDISPWTDGQLLPTPDGVIDVMDLAVLEHIVLTGMYPSGIPVYRMVFRPMQFATVTEPTELTNGMNAKVTLRLSNKGISVSISSAQKVKGLQLELGEVNSLVPKNAIVSSSFTQSQYYQDNSDLRILAYDGQSNALEAGDYLVASLPFTFVRPEELTINDIIVADENNRSMDKIEVEVIYEGTVTPSDYVLYQNYPNPFNPSTLVRFSVPKDEFVTVKIYDLLGQEVATLFEGAVKAGVYSMNWNGKNASGNMVSSGSYLYRMVAGDFVQSKKMMFLK